LHSNEDIRYGATFDPILGIWPQLLIAILTSGEALTGDLETFHQKPLREISEFLKVLRFKIRRSPSEGKVELVSRIR
jgi:hypothetical protein